MSRRQRKINKSGLVGMSCGGFFGYFAGKSAQLAIETVDEWFEQSEQKSIPMMDIVREAAVQGALASGAAMAEASIAGAIAVGQVMAGIPCRVAAVQAAVKSTWMGYVGFSLGGDRFFSTCAGGFVGLVGGVLLTWSVYKLYDFLRTEQSRELDRELIQLEQREKFLRAEIKNLVTKEIKVVNLQQEYNENSYFEPDEDTPDEFICGITQLIMNDPVKIDAYHTFERAAISLWYLKSPKKECPKDRISMVKDPQLLPTDKALQSKIVAYIKNRPQVSSTYTPQSG